MSILSAISFEDLNQTRLVAALLGNKIPEAQDLEFKRAAVGASDADRRGFLKVVSALTNTGGGDLLFGVAENDGVATAICGIIVRPAAEEAMRLESMLLSGIEPRLFGVRIKDIPVTEVGYVLVVKIPRIWNPPLRVNYGGVNLYYLRQSQGAYESTVDQLRAVFQGSMNAARRVQEFRLERLARLMIGERGFRLRGRGQLIIHTVPLFGGLSGFRMPSNQESEFDFRPRSVSSSIHRHNLEGLIFHAVSATDRNETRAIRRSFTTTGWKWLMPLLSEMICARMATRFP